MALGEAGKAHVFGLFETHGEAFLRQARRTFLLHLLDAPDACGTVEEIRDRVSAPPNPKAWGAVPSLLARLGIVAADGCAKSARTEAHARPVTRWCLIDPEAARRWIDAHREPQHIASILARLPELQEAAHA